MKYEVTPELAKLIKTMRVQNEVSAKDLAEHIGKSRSYISKLESGSIHTIDRDLLTQVLSIASRGDSFYDDVLSIAVKILRSTIDPERIVDQMWLFGYDVVERVIAVPPAMALDMANNLANAGISASDLVAFSNANIDSQIPPSFPANEFFLENHGGRRRLLMRINITEDDVSTVLNRKNAHITYFMLYTIVHAMFRLRAHPTTTTKLPVDEAADILRRVASYMDRWNIHSLIGYSHFLSSDEFIAHQMPLAQNREDVFDRIAQRLRVIASYDAAHTAEQMSAFEATLEWDPAFAMKIMEMPFAHLGDMSFSNKRKLLSELQGIFDSYAAMDEMERRMESY